MHAREGKHDVKENTDSGLAKYNAELHRAVAQDATLHISLAHHSLAQSAIHGAA